LNLRDVFCASGRKFNSGKAKTAWNTVQSQCPVLFGGPQNADVCKPLRDLGVVGFVSDQAEDLYIQQDMAVLMLCRGSLDDKSPSTKT